MNDFIIKLEETVEGYGFESSVAELFNNLDMPIVDEYVINWRMDDFDIIIDSVEADGETVWSESMVDDDDWTEDDDNLVEGLMSYIESNII